MHFHFTRLRQKTLRHQRGQAVRRTRRRQRRRGTAADSAPRRKAEHALSRSGSGRDGARHESKAECGSHNGDSDACGMSAPTPTCAHATWNPPPPPLSRAVRLACTRASACITAARTSASRACCAARSTRARQEHQRQDFANNASGASTLKGIEATRLHGYTEPPHAPSALCARTTRCSRARATGGCRPRTLPEAAAGDGLAHARTPRLRLAVAPSNCDVAQCVWSRSEPYAVVQKRNTRPSGRWRHSTGALTWNRAMSARARDTRPTASGR